MDETVQEAQEIVQPTEQPKEHTAQEFIDRYKSLVDETGYQLVITPVWIARDDNTYSMTLQTSVGKAPKQENK